METRAGPWKEVVETWDSWNQFLFPFLFPFLLVFLYLLSEGNVGDQGFIEWKIEAKGNRIII